MYLYYCNANLETTAAELVRLVAGFQTQLLNLEFVSNELYLCLEDDGLYVYSAQFKPLNLKHFYSDFIAKRKPAIKREILIQAINLRATADNLIYGLDTTAGLGRDAILMSLAGYRITMLENNPYLAVVLNYLCIEFAVQLPFLEVVYSDNLTYLHESNKVYNLIYLDPMFNDGKQALAKKDMQLIDLLIHQVSLKHVMDNQALFELAHKHCRQKLIVKRDNKQAELVNKPAPTYVKKGKTIRFDVYQCNEVCQK